MKHLTKFSELASKLKPNENLYLLVQTETLSLSHVVHWMDIQNKRIEVVYAKSMSELMDLMKEFNVTGSIEFKVEEREDKFVYGQRLACK